MRPALIGWAPSGTYCAPAFTAYSLKMAGFACFRNMGELICYFLSVKSAAYILLTRGVAFNWNFVFLAVRSPSFIAVAVRDITLGFTFRSDVPIPKLWYLYVPIVAILLIASFSLRLFSTIVCRKRFAEWFVLLMIDLRLGRSPFYEDIIMFIATVLRGPIEKAPRVCEPCVTGRL